MLPEQGRLVHPAQAGGRLDAAVFARTCGRRRWGTGPLPQAPDQVQVGQGRLHQQRRRRPRPGPAGRPAGLPWRCAGPSGAAPVAELGGGVRRLPERPVEGPGVLDGVAHDGGVGLARRLQGFAHGPDPAVHHVRGGHHVGSGLGVAHRHPGQGRHALVVDDLGSVVEAAVAGVRVGAQAHVGHDHQLLAEGLLESLDGAGHQAGGGVGGGGVRGLVGPFRHPEQQQRADAQLQVRLRLAQGRLDAVAGDAGQAGDLGGAFLGLDEVALDQVPGLEVGLGHQVAHGGGGAQTAGSDQHGGPHGFGREASSSWSEETWGSQQASTGYPACR